ncbi:MAG: YIP1 family protein [Anaerolineae bacterium]
MLGRILGVLTLRAKTYREIAQDSGATGQAAILVIVVALLGGIGGALVIGNFASSLPFSVAQIGSGLRYAITTILYTILGWLFTSWVFAYVSRIILKSKTTTLQMARVFGYTQVFAILEIIPYLGSALAFLLSLIGAIIGIREASKFDTGKAIITAVVGFIAYVVIIAVVNGVFTLIGLK